MFLNNMHGNKNLTLQEFDKGCAGSPRAHTFYYHGNEGDIFFYCYLSGVLAVVLLQSLLYNARKQRNAGIFNFAPS